MINIKYSNVNPLVFTEQGVAMLSSPTAIQINLAIMRTFAQYRSLLLENEELRNEIRKSDQKVNQSFKFLLQKIDALKGHNQRTVTVKGFRQKSRE